MKTIYRYPNGNLHLHNTVRDTIKELKHNSGYISVDLIREAINNQLPNPDEHVNRKRIMRILAMMIDSNPRKIGS